MGTREVGRAVGPGPRAGRVRSPGRSLPRDPGRATEARPGRPLLGGADRTRQGPGRGPRRAPRGSSPPRCHVPPALRLRDGPAPCSGSAGPGHIGMARGRPARDRTRGRASRPRADPPPGLGIPETAAAPQARFAPPSHPAPRRRRHSDVTPRDARRHFLLPSGLGTERRLVLASSVPRRSRRLSHFPRHPHVPRFRSWPQGVRRALSVARAPTERSLPFPRCQFPSLR